MGSLDELPNEVFELIVRELDLTSICNLRLVCHGICSKADQDTFRSFFRRKRLNVAMDDLSLFAEVTKGDLGCSIEELILIGLVYYPHGLERQIEDLREPDDVLQTAGDLSEKESQEKRAITRELAQARSDLDFLQQQHLDWQTALQEPGSILLTKAFSQIKRNARHGLKTLSLQVEIPQGASKPPFTPQDVFFSQETSSSVLAVASGVFSVAISSLRNSKIEIQHAFDVFTADPASLHCSLPYDALLQVMANDSEALGACFSALRSLSISFTDAAIISERSAQQLDEMALYSDVSAITQLIGLCANLECLQIYRYCLPLGNRLVSSATSAFYKSMLPKEFHQLISHTTLPILRTLRLGGMRAYAADIVELIRAHQATLLDVDLQKLHVTEGELSTVLEAVRDCKNLAHVRLEDISAPNPVLFEGSDVIDRLVTNAMDPIDYELRIRTGRQRASPELQRRQMRKRALFG